MCVSLCRFTHFFLFIFASANTETACSFHYSTRHVYSNLYITIKLTNQRSDYNTEFFGNLRPRFLMIKHRLYYGRIYPEYNGAAYNQLSLLKLNTYNLSTCFQIKRRHVFKAVLTFLFSTIQHTFSAPLALLY